MSKRQLLIILGIWVMVFLFLHFPPAWDKMFGLIAGLLIIIIAFKFRSPAKIIPQEKIPFAEHKSPNISGQRPPRSMPEMTSATPSTSAPPTEPDAISSTDSMSS